MTTPLVSIITPAYNSAAYIAETIASALAQTCTNFELIVADDESTDDTIDVARRAAGGDPRLIVVSTPHGGTSIARNGALAVSRGRFIALLDSDDVWMPNYLAEQITIAERCPDAGVISANAINRGGDFDGRPIWSATEGLRTLELHDLIVDHDTVCIMSVFRREVCERIGAFNPALKSNEDYEFWLRAANAGFRIVQNLRPLAYYRRRMGSVSSDDVRMLLGIIHVLESVGAESGPIEREREAIAAKIARLQDDLATARLRSSLSRRDATDAVRRLKELSKLRGSVSLAVAAKVTQAWPELLLHAYGLRRALRKR
jgi:glycosyltransferase involved in cell wall biosynthesis